MSVEHSGVPLTTRADTVNNIRYTQNGSSKDDRGGVHAWDLANQNTVGLLDVTLCTTKDGLVYLDMKSGKDWASKTEFLTLAMPRPQMVLFLRYLTGCAELLP